MFPFHFGRPADSRKETSPSLVPPVLILPSWHQTPSNLNCYYSLTWIAAGRTEHINHNFTPIFRTAQTISINSPLRLEKYLDSSKFISKSIFPNKHKNTIKISTSSRSVHISHRWPFWTSEPIFISRKEWKLLALCYQIEVQEPHISPLLYKTN